MEIYDYAFRVKSVKAKIFDIGEFLLRVYYDHLLDLPNLIYSALLCSLQEFYGYRSNREVYLFFNIFFVFLLTVVYKKVSEEYIYIETK